MKNDDTRPVLLTWDSFNNGFQVAVRAIEKLRSQHNTRISEVLYLQTGDLNEGNLAELKVFRKPSVWEEEERKIEASDQIKPDRKTEIAKRLAYVAEQAGSLEEEESKPLVTQKRLNLQQTEITNYQKIYDKVLAYLQGWMEQESRDFQLHINVSAGTPQMHVVWLMLNASGYLPPNTRIWSTQIDRKSKEQRLDAVNFKPRTYLSEILHQNSKVLPGPEINPNEIQSVARTQAIKQLELYAPVQAPLLILGERGVGKSTLVRKHLAERLFSKLPYRELACGTFREELFRSELFGYKQGAFTGANADKKGILDAIGDGGILFLDEIQDLSLGLQRELIQVLQTGQFYPIGSDSPQTAQFRLITATNRHPGELLAEGVLAHDFFDRVAHLHIEVPPLRNGRDDLPSLWSKIWKGVAQSRPEAPMTRALQAFLEKDALPGNFRDLQRLAASVYAHLQAHKVQSKSHTEQAVRRGLEDFQRLRALMQNAGQDSENYFRSGATFKEMDLKFRQDLAEWAIHEYGNIQAAAAALGRKESTLYQDKRGGK
jgi:DNA-binding NtrC family response regulator